MREKITLKELKARYPYQFEGKHIGRHVYPGWMEVFAELCFQVDKLLSEQAPDLKERFHWVQLKEKFGAGRFYYKLNDRFELRLDAQMPAKPPDPALIQSILLGTYVDEDEKPDPQKERESEVLVKIQHLAMAAESKTTRMCLICGAPGEVDSTGGWMMVLCPEHARERQERGNLNHHFPKMEESDKWSSPWDKTDK